MDIRTESSLKVFQSHSRIKIILTNLCYFLIVSSLFVYISYAFSHSRASKLVMKYKENSNDMQTEKIMTNPRIDFQYSDGEIYHVKAKRAFHRDNQRGVFYDVSAEGNIGNITAGELQVDEAGDRLIFTKDPVVILRKTEMKK